MIYYNVNDIVIRDMVETDPEIITHEEHLQGWVNQKIEKYTQRLKDVADGKCIALVAEYKGNVAGYFNVYPNSMGGSFGGKGLPELVDLHYILGQIYRVNKEYSEAIKEYKIALADSDNLQVPVDKVKKELNALIKQNVS